MQAPSAYATLLTRIDEYRKRYYVNELLKGTLLFLAVLLSAYLLVNTAEFVGRFNSTVRAGLFFGFLAFFVTGLVHYVVRPLLGLYGLRKPMSHEEAAIQIGRYFPDIGDKLLNTLQLQQLSAQRSELLQASLQQRSQQLLVTRFANAIQLQKNRRFLRYVLPPAAVILALLLFIPEFFAESSVRLVQYNREFTEPAPFTFQVVNDRLEAYRNEDFTLRVKLAGRSVPENVYVVVNDTRFKLERTPAGTFAYTFDKLQRSLDFQLEASGFRSGRYVVALLDRPAMLSFDVLLKYPSYLNKPQESLSNVGNLLVPQGTVIAWRFTADRTDSVAVLFKPGGAAKALPTQDPNEFALTRRLMQSADYVVDLKNKQASANADLRYAVQVIPDRYPQINVQAKSDSVQYNFTTLSGLLSDDYGFTRLKLSASVKRQGGGAATTLSRDLPINRSTTSQNFYYDWALADLNLQPGDVVEYFLQVWDNDGVIGPKSTRSTIQRFVVPTTAQLQEQINASADKTEQQISQTLERSQQIKRDLQALENRLRTRRTPDFQDKKQLQELLQKREELLNDIQKLQQQLRQTNDTQNRFTQQNERLQEKMQQLEKLFEQLQDPEAKRLYEELKKMLDRRQDEKASDLIDRLSRKERNFEKELDRALKLFKQLQMEQRVEQAIFELEKLADQQQKLADESKQNNANNSSLEQQQQQTQEQFKQLTDELDKIQQEAEQEKLTQPDVQEQQQEQIEQQMQQATQQLQRKQNKSASQTQTKTAQQMRQMAKQMAESMESAEMNEMQQNLSDLRYLLENLITLSFDQEKVMKDFRSMSPHDPRVTKLSQQQLKLQSDAKVIEDSLNALAQRVVQMQSFVTRELTDMKYYMDESVKLLQERRTSAASSRQQFAMTSMNNLALMLNDVMKQMLQAMNAMAMPSSGKGKKQQGQPSDQMGKQQQQLNERMQQLGKGDQSGQSLSRELSQLAAEQAMIRRMLQEAQQRVKGTELGKKLDGTLTDLAQKMDETETDLVNKRVNANTLKRQQEILTRLLESEKAIKQQEEDTKRQANTAKDTGARQSPVAVEAIKQRSKQLDVLRTVPPDLNTYYKNASSQYLRRVAR